MALKMGGIICDSCKTIIPKDKVRYIKTKKGVQHACSEECEQKMMKNKEAGNRARRDRNA